MYKDNSKYVYDEETAKEGEDFWFIEHCGEKVMQRKANGGGTVIEFGGPCGPLYLDEFGNQ